ncbi:MAG: carboxypeptidase regulatory-like domain-containing protein [Muribaculaceae bacterium]|nr:carboxypeptidase regulatory-like domain-containing protein [Muribaculaceae bacterium]
MKKIFTIIAIALLAVASVNAKSASQLKVYINPGHGNWSANDRPMALVNKAINDTTGFFESNTNIRKGLAIYHKLRSYGLTANGNGRDLSQHVVMSHVRCNPSTSALGTSNTFDGTYSRALAVIAAEVEQFGGDMFISVHSNAASEGTKTNYPLFLYRGTDSDVRATGSNVMAQSCWPYAYGNANQVWSHYSLTSMNIRGDVSYMGSDGAVTNSYSGISYSGYYGVLKHGTPGFLVEGYFHTYQPSRHRAMNWDVDYIEGYSYARGIADYFSISKESTGDIYGLVRSAEEYSSTLGSLYTANSSSDDVYLPLNGATVTLKNSSGTTVATYTTDGFSNGAFVFKDLTPGTYTVTAAKSGYVSQTKTVVVTAATTNYCTFTDGTHNFLLSKDTGGGGGGGGSVTVDYTGMTTHNPFAYDVTTSLLPAGVNVSYKLVGRPTRVDVELYSGSTLVKSIQGNITSGTNTVYFPMIGMAAGTYKAKVKVTGSAISSPTAVNDGNGNLMSYRFYAPWGVACNNCTESATFGEVDVVESYITQQSSTYMSGSGNGVGMGVYRFTPTFVGIKNSSNSYGFTCGMTPVGSNNCAENDDLKRIKYTDDGRLFVCRQNNSNSSVWEIYSDWQAQQFFRGSGAYINQANTLEGGGRMYTSNGGTFVAGPATGFDFIGSGSNLKMVICSQNLSGSGTVTYNGQRSRIDIYNIGTYDDHPYWFQAPSTNVSNGSYWVTMYSDVACGQYNFYVSQYRGSPSESEPGHVGYNYSGSRVTINTDLSSQYAGMAFDKTKTRLAKNTSGTTVGIYTPRSDGMLDGVQYSFTFPSRVSAIAWDYADNIYVTTNWGEYVRCYAIPRSDNTATTPARSAYDINWTVPSVYILGNCEGNSFVPNVGRQMTYDANAKTYTYEGNLTDSGDGYAYFSFSHSLSSSSSDWSSIAASRFGSDAAAGTNYWVLDGDYDTPLALKYYGSDTRAFHIPTGTYRMVVSFAADAANPTLTITRLSTDVEAWQPSANYTVDTPVLLGTRAYSDGNRSIGVSNGYIYTLHQRIDNNASASWVGFFGSINHNGQDFSAAKSSNISASETYMFDFTAASDDAGNLVFGSVNKTSTAPNNAMLAVGNGQGMDRFMIIPANGGGIGNTSITAAQSVTFGLGSVAIPDRTQLMRASGDFSSAQGGFIWLVPSNASVIWKGGYKNVTTSGGQIIDATLINTGFSVDNGVLHSANPYGDDGLMLSVRGRGICDGKIVGSRYQSFIVSSTARHTHGHPSMFILQDHKLLVCCTGDNGTANLGLFEVTNDASGNYSMSQIGSDLVPFVTTNVSPSYLRGTVTKAIPVDDLTYDIYCYTNGSGFSQYRIHLSPVPVTAGSGSANDLGTSQTKTISWTKGSGTTPVGYNVEVSTDGGSTWTTAATYEDVTTETWTDTNASRATLDCQYRISAVYDSYTSAERHASAPCATISVSAQRPTKAVTSPSMSFSPQVGTSSYNSTADLVDLYGTLTWNRPKSIESDSRTFPASATGNYGFEISGYRLTVAGSDGSYATDTSGNSLNAFTIAATGTMAGDTPSIDLRNLKRDVSYTVNVEPVYNYMPSSATSYGTTATVSGQSWAYSVEAVRNFSVDTYVQRNAPFNEWWGDHSQTVYYDVYRVEITLDAPASSTAPVSYHKVEMSTDNGVTWSLVTDRPHDVAAGISGATSATYPTIEGMPLGCFPGNHDFSVRSKPDNGFANNVNIGFYHFVAKGLTPASFNVGPRASETPTPDNWTYRVTTYYGSSPSATISGETVTPNSANVGASTSVTVNASDPVITGIENVITDANALKVYPNPTEGALNIVSPEPIETVRVVTIGGALMRTFAGSRLNSQTIDISDLGRGNYFVIVNAQKPVAVIRR